MTTNVSPMQHSAASLPHVDQSRRQMRNAEAPARYDPYLVIHKGLRALMTDTLQRIGRMDPWDDEDTAQALAQLRELVALAESHLHHEDLFVHPAMEARAPGSTRSAEAGHLSHRVALAGLLEGCASVERSAGENRAAAALSLYRRLALFVAEDLQHMHVEETQNNAVLWATHTDAELHALVDRLVASMPPATNAKMVRWMVVSSSPDERATLLRGARQAMPAGAFEAMLGALAPGLSAKDRVKLEAALA
jgi:hypothetical protein